MSQKMKESIERRGSVNERIRRVKEGDEESKRVVKRECIKEF